MLTLEKNGVGVCVYIEFCGEWESVIIVRIFNEKVMGFRVLKMCYDWIWGYLIWYVLVVWSGMFLYIWWSELKLACFVLWYGFDDGSIRHEIDVYL